MVGDLSRVLQPVCRLAVCDLLLIWLHYILVVIFCCAVGMLTEAYRQRLARFINLTKRSSRILSFSILN